MRPTEWLDACAASHHRLVEAMTGLTDQQARQPSLLPDWSVGHALTHIARNADGMRGMFEAAMTGVVGDQYPGGDAQRDGDIEAGSARPAAELVADVRTSAERLEAAWSAGSGDEVWERAGRTRVGTFTMAETIFRRLREVEVHHADLGLAYSPADWPDVYIAEELRRGLANLPDRADHRALVAWLMGRSDPPPLAHWT